MKDLTEKESGGKKLSRVVTCVTSSVSRFFSHPKTVPCEHLPQKYSYIFRRKSRWELTRISATVCGIEFCYAAETAFVTPVLLSLGLDIKYVSMIWCLSPLLAFILTPILGSFSDSCRSRYGRRRPFIVTLSIGIVVGLLLVPYGGRFGLLLGDDPRSIFVKVSADIHNETSNFGIAHTAQHEITEHSLLKSNETSELSRNKLLVAFVNSTRFDEDSDSYLFFKPNISRYAELFDSVNKTLPNDVTTVNTRIFGIVLTVLGTVFLDFCADVCQSPCRAYLIDITIPGEQATALTIFTLNSGIGAAVGYGICAIKWDISLWGNILEAHVIVSFAFITVLYIIFVATSLYSFPEIPLSLLQDPLKFKEYQEKKRNSETDNNAETRILPKNQTEYSSIKENISTIALSDNNTQEMKTVGKVYPTNSDVKTQDSSAENEFCNNHINLREYLKSIIFMPKSLRILSLTNFLYGMGIISYTLFFTDFVGECVFDGDPQAPKDSRSYELYKDGVRFGCWGMMFCSISSSVYSCFVEDLAERFGAKLVFSGGAVVYSAGMILMGATRDKVAVIILSATAGIMLTTLSTLPYILVAHYHNSQKFKENGKANDDSCVRGIGTDIATIISVIVLSQCILSLSMGTVVEAIGSNIVIVCSAAFFSVCGAISATKVMYLDI